MILPSFKPPVSEPADVTIVNLDEVVAAVREHAIHAVAYNEKLNIDQTMFVNLRVNGKAVRARLDILARTTYGTPDMMSLRTLQHVERSVHHYVLMYGGDEKWFAVQQRFTCPEGHSLSMSPLGFTVTKD